MHVLQSTASSPPSHKLTPPAPFFAINMFRSSFSKKTKQKQPGPTMIQDFPQPAPPIYYHPHPSKKKKHANYTWAPLETYSNSPPPPPRSRSNSTPHVRFSADTLEREREKDRGGRRNSFADYFGRYTHRDSDSRRRYRGYRKEEGYGYVSTLVDPDVQRLGREQRRQQQEEHHHHHHHHRHHRRRHSEQDLPDAWPESIYYLGTADSPPLFLSERESRHRRSRERGLQEFIAANGGRQSRYEYVERKSLPPGKGLRRVKTFFRGEEW